MHVVTHLSPKYTALMNSENGWSIEEAGMVQLDDIVGSVMQYLKDNGLDDNTIVVFTTDNGTETFTWPDGGQTPFAQAKGTVMEGGFRVPCIVRWPGHVPENSVQNGIFSGMDWFPTFLDAAGNPNITDQLLKGVRLGDRTYKNHLDGYDQMAAITGKGPSTRHEIFYLGESTSGNYNNGYHSSSYSNGNGNYNVYHGGGYAAVAGPNGVAVAGRSYAACYPNGYVNFLPGGYRAVAVNGAYYYYANGVYYQPEFYGGATVYVVVGQ